MGVSEGAAGGGGKTAREGQEPKRQRGTRHYRSVISRGTRPLEPSHGRPWVARFRLHVCELLNGVTSLGKEKKNLLHTSIGACVYTSMRALMSAYIHTYIRVLCVDHDSGAILGSNEKECCVFSETVAIESLFFFI